MNFKVQFDKKLSYKLNSNKLNNTSDSFNRKTKNHVKLIPSKYKS